MCSGFHDRHILYFHIDPLVGHWLSLVSNLLVSAKGHQTVPLIEHTHCPTDS